MPLGASQSGVEEVSDPETGLPVLRVSDPNALTQALGWLKFRTGVGQVLLRGQSRLYPAMMASGFRPGPGGTPINIDRGNLAAKLHASIDALTGAGCACDWGPFKYGQAHYCSERVGAGSNAPGVIVKGTYRAAVEPLLQHYGLKTRWLDVVDNVWIALWFACHRQQAVGRHAVHLRRSPAQEPSDAKAYIAVVGTGLVKPTKIPGYWIGEEIRLVDLRYCVPSVYLRPHAQHGLLIAPAKLPDPSACDLMPRVIAFLEIRLADALEWLGDGAMTSSFVLFPPATRDEGYRRLLELSTPATDTLGQITIYGPGY